MFYFKHIALLCLWLPKYEVSYDFKQKTIMNSWVEAYTDVGSPRVAARVVWCAEFHHMLKQEHHVFLHQSILITSEILCVLHQQRQQPTDSLSSLQIFNKMNSFFPNHFNIVTSLLDGFRIASAYSTIEQHKLVYASSLAFCVAPYSACLIHPRTLPAF